MENRKSSIDQVFTGLLVLSAGICLLAYLYATDLPEHFSAGRAMILHVQSIQDGIPAEVHGQLMKKTGFWLSYDEQFEQPDWTAYILTRKMVLSGTEERSENFRPDTNVITGSASPSDYRGSGFDRGHLVPAADMKWSPESMSESFLMSNMSPQVPGFNRGVWKRLEEKVRQWAVKNDSLFIITGPVPGSITQTIGQNKVGIPEYYFKIIMDISWPDYKGIAFLIRNEPSDRNIFDFAVSIDSIEKILSTDFFPDQDPKEIEYIEGSIDLRQWR